jgi:hypothetical protein
LPTAKFALWQRTGPFRRPQHPPICSPARRLRNLWKDRRTIDENESATCWEIAHHRHSQPRPVTRGSSSLRGTDLPIIGTSIANSHAHYVGHGWLAGTFCRVVDSLRARAVNCQCSATSSKSAMG